MEILPTGMLPILNPIMQVLSTVMLPILTSMTKVVLGQFNLEFAKDERDSAKDDSDDGGLQVKFWLVTDLGVKCIFGCKVVTNLNQKWETRCMQEILLGS